MHADAFWSRVIKPHERNALATPAKHTMLGPRRKSRGPYNDSGAEEEKASPAGGGPRQRMLALSASSLRAKALSLAQPEVQEGQLTVRFASMCDL